MRKGLVLTAALTVGFCLPAEAGRYGIRLEEQGEERVLAVAREDGAAVAAAAGGKALRLLPASEARAAYDRLAEGWGIAPTAPANDDHAADRRIIIHRPDIAEDLSNGASEREQGVIRRHLKPASPADDDSPFEEPRATETAPASERVMIKRTEFVGADDATAAAFIDAVAGFTVIRVGADKPSDAN
jgi:hypothetical protein